MSNSNFIFITEKTITTASDFFGKKLKTRVFLIKGIFTAIALTFTILLVPPALNGYRFLLGFEQPTVNPKTDLNYWNDVIFDNPDNPVWKFASVTEFENGDLTTYRFDKEKTINASRSHLLPGFTEFLVLREKQNPDGTRVGEFGQLVIPGDELPRKLVSLGFSVSNFRHSEVSGWKFEKNGKKYFAEIHPVSGEEKEDTSVWLLVYLIQ